MFSNPKIKQRNITYLPSFQTDIETILRLVLTVLRKMPLLQYYNIFNPSEEIYTQDKRIFDCNFLQNDFGCVIERFLLSVRNNSKTEIIEN